MPFRDDEEQLLARVARLEDRLRAEEEDKGAHEAALKQRVADLERQLAEKEKEREATMPPRPGPLPVAGVPMRRLVIDRSPRPFFDVSPSPPPIPPLLSEGIAWTFTIVPVASGIFGVGFLPMLGVGQLVSPVACPAAYRSSYTKRYREIVNGNVSDHWEFHCVTRTGEDIVGDEGLVYLAGFGIPVTLSLVVLTMVTLARYSRIRAQRRLAAIEGDP